jgi:hypothetical protein
VVTPEATAIKATTLREVAMFRIGTHRRAIMIAFAAVLTAVLLAGAGCNTGGGHGGGYGLGGHAGTTPTVTAPQR